MENRFEHNEPEQQSWKRYLPPINPPGMEPPKEQQVQQDALCAWVCEKLSDLLDNDGSVRPEQAAGIHGHLAVCRPCAQVWEEMQNMVRLVENVPPVELPRDFAPFIMQRIEMQTAPFAFHALAPQPVAETSENAVVQAWETPPARVKSTPGQTVESETQVMKSPHRAQASATTQIQTTQTCAAQLQTTHVQQTHAQLFQRLSAGGMLSALTAWFLSNAWVRQMLGTNVAAASAWLGQAGDVLRSVPVVTWIFGLIFSALAQVNAMLSHTYQTMGTAAAAGLGMDVIICVFAYMYLSARRRSAQMQL